MKRRTHILFTSTFVTPFIAEDIQLLRRHFPVRQSTAHGWFAPFKLFSLVWKFDLTFSWFASVYSSFLVLTSLLLNKKSIVVLGGGDAAFLPELHYGIWNSKWKSALLRYALPRASAIIAVDDSLKHDIIKLAHYGGENISTIPTGYDAEQWKPASEKENLVLTVANCPDEQRLQLKGIDRFIEAAEHLPEFRFVAVGISDVLRQSLHFPANFEAHSFIAHDSLHKYYQRAKVYCQLSRRDGLPNSLCEAMLCGCVPVGTKTGGIPTAIGNTGFLVDGGDAQETASAIQHAMKEHAEKSREARNRIINNFSLEQREQSLVNLINRLCT